jgi:hypothetical protein
MDEDPVKAALQSLFEKHIELEQTKNFCRSMLESLEAEDAKLQPKIVALASALDTPVDPESDLGKYLTEIAASGITEGVRTVLRAAAACRTPIEIREGLLRLGYNLSGQNSAMASIHTILLRLIDKGEVEKVKRARTKEVAYMWKAEPQETSELAKQLKMDLDYLRTERKPDPLSKINS